MKENEEFPAKIRELIQAFTTKKTDISVTKGKAGELTGMIGEVTEAQNQLKAFAEPNDRFQDKLDKYIKQETQAM